MAQATKGIAHGLFKVMVGLVDDNGFNYGTAGAGAAEGTTLYPHILTEAQSATLPNPSRTTVDFTGDDGWVGSYIYGITSIGTSEVTSATMDSTLIALLSNSSADSTTNSRFTMFSENVLENTPPQVWVAISYRLQARDSGIKGANKYITSILPRAWVTPAGLSGAPSFQSQGTYSYTLQPTSGDRFPFGLRFECTNLSLANNEGVAVHLISDNPVHMVGHVATNAATTETITLPFKIAGATSITTPDSSTDPVIVTIDGKVVDATSVDIANSTVTVSPISPATSFSGGEYIGIFYETNYEPSSAAAANC
ncbi:MAG: hypothetical protein D6712_10605 [Chloroflexi bacterium]|nr:MAG: hypothetical protein D6712_10605 [Chloroflexota bacterium]